MAFRGSKVWLWRWRRNPLRRRADKVEAWVVLGAWLLTALAGVVAGLATSRSVEGTLARERVEWRQVEARLVAKAPGTFAGQTGTASSDQVWAKVRWAAPDGSSHTGQVRVRPGSVAGTPVAVWTDRGGPPGHPPHDPGTGAPPRRPDRRPRGRERGDRALRRRPHPLRPPGTPPDRPVGRGLGPLRTTAGPDDGLIPRKPRSSSGTAA